MELRDKDFGKPLRVDMSEEIVCSYFASLPLEQDFDDFESGRVLHDDVISSIYLESKPVYEVLKGEHKLRSHHRWTLVLLKVYIIVEQV